MPKSSKTDRPSRRHYKPSGPKPPQRLPPGKKKSPNSLRLVFTAMRNTADAGEQVAQPEFLEKLQQAWDAKGPRYNKRPTDQIFRATEDGTAALFYWEIEAYAHVSTIPSGVLLLISRLIEHKRHVSEQHHDAKVGETRIYDDLLRGIPALLATYKSHIADKELIDDQDIKRLITSYAEACALAILPEDVLD